MKTLCVFILMATVSVSLAQTHWTSAVPGDWTNALNWDNGLPGAGNNAVFDGGGLGTCNLTADAFTPTLTIQAGFTGTISLNNFTLNVGPGVDHDFLGGTITGPGTVSITSNSGAEFDGTIFGANVILTVNLATAAGIFEGDGGTTFGGPVTVTAHSILLNGSKYNSTASFTKSSAAAASSSTGEGGNEFNGVTTIVNAMNAALITANNQPDVFKGLLTLSLSGTSVANAIHMAYASGGNQFENHIRVRTDNTSTLAAVASRAQMTFGANGGTSTLAEGFTIDEVDPVLDEFLYGELSLNNFTQLGATTQSISLQVPAASPSISRLRLLLSNCIFFGDVNFTATISFVSNSTFNGNFVFTKQTGGGSGPASAYPASNVNTWAGGNTYNSTATFIHYNSATWVLARVNPDTYNGDVTFDAQQSDAHYRIAENGINQFKGNVTFTRFANTPEVKYDFGRGGGIALFNGGALQTIESTESIPGTFVRFWNMRLQNASGVVLNFPATINGTLDLLLGVLQTNASDTLTFHNNAISSNASDLSYIDGPVQKRGDDAFVFPLGDGGSYHPIGISAPLSTTAMFSAQYTSGNHGLGALADGGLVKVSDCEFWTLNRMVSTDNPTATLFWNAPFCRTDYIKAGFEGDVRVARWAGAIWNNLGQSNLQVGAAADGTDGNLTTAASLPDAASHTLTFGTVVVENAMPIILSEFRAVSTVNGVNLIWQTSSEHNNDFFTIERLHEGKFMLLSKVQGAGTTNLPKDYEWLDTNPLPGLSYYRLKQTDFDGSETYSEVVALQRPVGQTPYPNPAKDIIFLDGLNFDEDSKLIITDLTGRTVYSGEATSSLDVQHFLPGIYHLAIKSKRGVKRYSIKKE